MIMPTNSIFDPGPEWRELGSNEVANPFLRELLTWDANGEARRRRWVREDPVPPLPTDPYTIIRVTPTGDEWWLDRRRNWRDLVDGNLVETVNITGFEVRARPAADYAYDRVTAMEQVRRDTAKAVLSRVRDVVPHSGAEQMEPWIQAIAIEFGADPHHWSEVSS